MKKSVLIIAAIIVMIVILGIKQKTPEQNPSIIINDTQPLSATKPAGLFTYRLSGSGISSSASSFTLNSLTLPQNGYPVQDSDVSDTFYLTIEPGSTDRQEFVSCTTIGSNTGGSVTISGCTRGLSPITPYTASSTLQFAHSGASAVIFSDPPQLFNEFPAKGNSETITGAWNFGTAPTSSDECTTSTEYCTRHYVDLQVAAGFSASNVAFNSGLITLGTAPETVSILLSTANSSVLSGLATSTNKLVINTGYGLTIGTDNQLKIATSTDYFKFAQTATSTAGFWAGSAGTNSLDMIGGDIYVQDDLEVDGSFTFDGITRTSIPYIASSTIDAYLFTDTATSSVATTTIAAGEPAAGDIYKFTFSGTKGGTTDSGKLDILLEGYYIFSGSCQTDAFTGSYVPKIYGTLDIMFGSGNNVTIMGYCNSYANNKAISYTTTTLNYISEPHSLVITAELKNGGDTMSIDGFSLIKY